jgi:hypothetical protein
MGVLMFTARIHSLLFQKSDIEYRIAKLTKKLQDLQSYAAMVGNRGISIGDLLSAPGSQMGRAMAYLAFAHNSSYQYMMQNAPYMTSIWTQQMQGTAQNPAQQQQMQRWIMESLYQQGRDRALQIEQRNLKIEEDKIAQEKEKLVALGQSVQVELEEARKGRDAAIKEMAPKYTFA